LIFNDKGIEKWWYDLPSFTLRSRNQTKLLELENENQSLQSVSSFVTYSVVQIEETVEDTRFYSVKTYDYDTQIAKFDLSDEAKTLGRPQIVENKYVISQTTENETIITLYETPKTEIAKASLSKNNRCAVRLDEKYLTITDEFGRVIIFDHKDKILRKNLRY
jgi:hypothetical protein